MAASIGLHAAFAAAALLLSPLRTLVVPPPEPIAVEIISTEEFSALERPAPTLDTAPEVRNDTPVAPAVAAQEDERLTPSGPLEPALPQGETVTATDFYSAGILLEPGMEKIRRTLRGFADSERIVQVCNIEAIEQIKRGAPAYDPDTVVSYAMADPLWNGLLFTAPGGAFRSRRKWYEVTFHCRVAPGYEGVTAFDFTIGASIPQSQWEERNLNAEDRNDD